MRPEAIVAFAGRALLALLFILAGAAKALTPQPFLAHMAEFGVPGVLLPGVIALELVGGAVLLSGWRAQYAAGALGLFCVLTAGIFHADLADKVERTLFLKDLAIAGGLLFVAATAFARGRAEAKG